MKNTVKNTLGKVRNLSRLAMVALLPIGISMAALANEKNTLAQPVEIIAVDDFKLAGQLIKGNELASGVLLLPDCQHSKTKFNALAMSLAKQGLFVLSMDLRGFGASENEQYSQAKILQNADGIVSYQGQVAALMLHWQRDVYHAFQYLQKAMNNNQTISIITSGCSSSQAIYLAEKVKISSFVMIAPELSYDEKEQFKHLADLPVYFLSAKHQTDAMLNAQELFEWSGDNHSVLQVFKGNASSYFLLKQQPYLIEHIAMWLKTTLSDTD